jgi:hypothetical protein
MVSIAPPTTVASPDGQLIRVIPSPSFAFDADAKPASCVTASITVCEPPFIEIPTDSNSGIGARPEIVPVSELPADTEEGERVSGTVSANAVPVLKTKKPPTRKTAAVNINKNFLIKLMKLKQFFSTKFSFVSK